MSTTTDRPAPDWDIRVPTREQLRTYTTPARLAFAEEISDAELDDWLKLAEPERWLGAFESTSSDLVIGTASAHSMRLTVPGGEVPVAAVTGVAVRPDHRRRGVLRALMRRQLDDVRARGEPVAALWASEAGIYPRFGYGLAAMDGTFEIDTARTTFTRPLPAEGRVRIVDEDEAARRFPPVYEVMRERTPGALTRTETWWRSATLADPEYSRRGASTKYRVLFEVGGDAEGYAIYRIKDSWDHRGPDHRLEVREAVAVTPRALQGLWRYLFDVDLVRHVKADHVAVPNPLQHVLAEPRALGLFVGDGLWLRLVDLPAALSARRYGAVDTIVLEVGDRLCPRNAGSWRLETTGTPGTAEAAVGATGERPDLVLDTTDLAAVYLGGVRPSELAAAGRIVERTSGALRRADALFSADPAPWCLTMF